MFIHVKMYGHNSFNEIDIVIHSLSYMLLIHRVIYHTFLLNLLIIEMLISAKVLTSDSHIDFSLTVDVFYMLFKVQFWFNLWSSSCCFWSSSASFPIKSLMENPNPNHYLLYLARRLPKILSIIFCWNPPCCNKHQLRINDIKEIYNTSGKDCVVKVG